MKQSYTFFQRVATSFPLICIKHEAKMDNHLRPDGTRYESLIAPCVLYTEVFCPRGEKHNQLVIYDRTLWMPEKPELERNTSYGSLWYLFSSFDIEVGSDCSRIRDFISSGRLKPIRDDEFFEKPQTITIELDFNFKVSFPREA